MAAELDKLRLQTMQLADKFRQQGYVDIAGDLDINAQSLLDSANKARRLGLNSLTPTASEPYVQSSTELVTLSAEQLIETEKRALTTFFGREIMVPTPSAELFQTLEKLTELGIEGFEPHYLPSHAFHETDSFPGWKVKPFKWFWQRLEEGTIAEDSATIHEGWYLVDGRAKPDYNEGLQVYRNDYLATTILSLRGEGRIPQYRTVPAQSRFAISPTNVEEIVLPEFAHIPEIKNALGSSVLRNKRYIEFNILGNLHHPEWGQTNTWEWFTDKVFGGSYRFIGGHIEFGGFARVDSSWADDFSGHAGFSPLIEIIQPSNK